MQKQLQSVDHLVCYTMMSVAKCEMHGEMQYSPSRRLSNANCITVSKTVKFLHEIRYT